MIFVDIIRKLHREHYVVRQNKRPRLFAHDIVHPPNNGKNKYKLFFFMIILLKRILFGFCFIIKCPCCWVVSLRGHLMHGVQHLLNSIVVFSCFAALSATFQLSIASFLIELVNIFLRCVRILHYAFQIDFLLNIHQLILVGS